MKKKDKLIAKKIKNYLKIAKCGETKIKVAFYNFWLKRRDSVQGVFVCCTDNGVGLKDCKGEYHSIPLSNCLSVDTLPDDYILEVPTDSRKELAVAFISTL